MAKVTEQDVINYLKQRVDQLTKDLDTAQTALLALQGSAEAASPVRRGRKPNAAGQASTRKKSLVKQGGAKRGRKPRVKETPSEQLIVADQLG